MSKFVTESQVAETYQVSVRTVRRLISAGTLTAYRIGPRLIRLDADEVERVMLANPVCHAVTKHSGTHFAIQQC